MGGHVEAGATYKNFVPSQWIYTKFGALLMHKEKKFQQLLFHYIRGVLTRLKNILDFGLYNTIEFYFIFKFFSLYFFLGMQVISFYCSKNGIYSYTL